DPEHNSGADLLQDCRPNEAPHHGASPVIRNVTRGYDFRNISDVGLGEIINQKTPNRNLGSHINKNRNHSKHEMAVLPYALVLAGFPVALSLRHGRQFENGDHYSKCTER